MSLIQASAKLGDDDRAKYLTPLEEAGWSLVDNRDAIYKEFQFADFNQVLIYFIF